VSSLLAADEGASLRRYRAMAWIVGVTLAVLCFVALPLQYAFNRPALGNAGWPIHGVLYIVYLATVVDLARRIRPNRWRLAAMVGAGFVPLLAFYVEHRVTQSILTEPR
jgi:integral membrane protein